MLHDFLKALESNNRMQIITDRDNLQAYLQRWYVAFPHSSQRSEEDRNIPFNTFIHLFWKSDEPVFHTHPWDWFHSTILKCGYWEHTPWAITWQSVGSSRYVDCNKMRHLGDDPSRPLVPANLHWIEIPKPGETWTLFTRGPKKDNGWWGFMDNFDTGEIVFHETYLEQHRVKNESNEVGPQVSETG